LPAADGKKFTGKKKAKSMKVEKVQYVSKQSCNRTIAARSPKIKI